MTTAHFYAIWSTARARSPVVEEFSAATGRPIRRVLSLPASELRAGLLVQGPGGWLWYTNATGPVLQNNTAGGDPKPNSCSGAVIRIDPITGAETTVLRSPTSQWLGAAVPSPDGRYVAFEAAPCARSFMNAHMVVRDLATGREWDVSAGARVCHDLSPASWVAPGTSLVLGYGPSSLGPKSLSGEGFGMCQSPAPDELAVVGSLRAFSIGSARTVRAARGCGYVEAVADAWGYLALEECGGYNLGPDALVQLSSRLAVTGRWRLPPEADGTSLAVSPNRSLVLVDEYEAPAYSGTATVRQAAEWIEVFNGHRLTVVTHLPDASSSIESACF